MIEKRLDAVAPHLLRTMLQDALPRASDVAAEASEALRHARDRYMAAYDLTIPHPARREIITLANRIDAAACGVEVLGEVVGTRAERKALADELGPHLPAALEAVLDVLRALFVQTMLDRQARAAQLAEEATKEVAQASRQIYFISINAVVEAARAGEAGRGFAVIVQQIRALAQQTSASLRRLTEATDGASRQVVPSLPTRGAAPDILPAPEPRAVRMS